MKDIGWYTKALTGTPWARIARTAAASEVNI
jgi:hypothetical protein